MTMEILAWVAAVPVFACFFMKTMIPLRGLAIASHFAFIGDAALAVHDPRCPGAGAAPALV